MPTKQRAVLLVLVFLSVIQQGVRWSATRQEPVITASVQAAETVSEQESDGENRHCDLVHVNTAGMAELQTLPGIGRFTLNGSLLNAGNGHFWKSTTYSVSRGSARSVWLKSPT